MSIWTSAILAYGLEIPADIPTDRLDAIIKPIGGDLGHATAGGYDSERRYLVTGYHEAELNKPKTVDLPVGEQQYLVWRSLLRRALLDLGLDPTAAPAWHLIAAQS